MKDAFLWFLVAVLAALAYFAADFFYFPAARHHPAWEYDAVGVLAAILVAANFFFVWRNKKRRRPNGNWN